MVGEVRVEVVVIMNEVGLGLMLRFGINGLKTPAAPTIGTVICNIHKTKIYPYGKYSVLPHN